MHRLSLLLGVVMIPHTAHPCTGNAPTTAELIERAPDVFTWFDQASAVVEAKVTAAPGFSVEGHGMPGTVALAVTKVLKGKPGKKLSYEQPATACGGTSAGTVEVVFVDAHGKPLGFAGTSVESALEAWRTAAADDKRAVLTRLAKSSDPAVAGAASKRLAR
jgi:hypothetical protein